MRIGLLVLVLMCAAAAGAVAANVMSVGTAPRAEVVRAERFELVDGAGKVRGVMGLTGGVAARRAVLGLPKEKGRIVEVQPVTVGGGPEISLYDEEGRVRARLFLDVRDSATLELLDEEGNVVLSLPGGPGVEFLGR